MPGTLVFLPTYNERDNIAGIVCDVLSQGADIEALVSRRWRATRLPQASLMQALYAVRPEWWKRFSSRAPFFITGSYLKLLTKDPATRGRLQTKLVVAVLDGEVTDRRSAVTFLKRQIAQTDKTEHCIIE